MNIFQSGTETSVQYYSIALAALISVLAVQLILQRRTRNAIRYILGPRSRSWIFGHTLQLQLPLPYGEHEFRWQKQFGSVYRLKGCFGQDRLMVADPVALQHILNTSIFVRGGMPEALIAILYGEKSVIAAKDEHRRLRSNLNVGFTAAAVRNYQPVFETAAESISEQLEKCPASSIDICPLLSTATLSAVSEAILRYSVQDLGEDFVANNVQIAKLIAHQSKTEILLDALSVRFPPWLWRAAVYLPTTAFKIARQHKHLSHQIGLRIVQERKNAVKQGLDLNDDLFSRLLDQSLDNNMTEDEIAAQVGILLLAGQETTANSIAFGLLELARHPDFQEKLRTEIHSSRGIFAYDSMPLLNAFIKETIRLYPAVPLSERVALQDTTIPLAEAITISTGEHISQIPICKGQIMTLAIASYQRLELRWGADAHEFNPSRWLDGTAHLGDAVGPYANLLSFLGGPRTCLGWRFAILEMQVVLCEMVAKFSFAPVESESIQPQYLNIILPIVSNGEKALPLCITRI